MLADRIDIIIVDASGVYPQKCRNHLRTFVKALKEDPRLVVTVVDNVNNESSLATLRNQVFWSTTQKYVCFMDFDFGLDFNFGWDEVMQALDGDIGCVDVVPRSRNSMGQAFTDTLWPTCHVMAFRRDVAEKLGPFDERYKVFQADLDTLRRVWGMGLRVAQHNRSSAIHLHFSAKVSNRTEIHRADCALFIEKFKDTIWTSLPSPLTLSPNKGFVGIYDEDGWFAHRFLAGLLSYLRRDNETKIYAGGRFTEPPSYSAHSLFPRSPQFWKEELGGCRFMFICDGGGAVSPANMNLRNECRCAGIPFLLVGPGWMSSDYLSLWGDGKFLPAGEHAQQKLKVANSKGRWMPHCAEYVLIPIPLIRYVPLFVGNYEFSLQEFVNHCQRKFKGQRIVFHHTEMNINIRGNGRSELTNKDFWEIARWAYLVYGIDHMKLIGAAHMGVPIETLDAGLASMVAGLKKPERDKAFLSLADYQIPVGVNDLGYWLAPIMKEARRASADV